MDEDLIPNNVIAIMEHLGKGNPPSTHLHNSVSNCYPGLEFDLRGVLAKFLEGVIFHETSNIVMGVESDELADLKNDVLREIRHPQLGAIPVSYPGRGPVTAVERANNLAELIANHGGQEVEAVFLPRPILRSVTSFLQLDNGSFPPKDVLDFNARSNWVSAEYTSADNPQVLEWDFETEVECSGVTVFRGEDVLATLFPDRIRVQVAADGDPPNWVPIGEVDTTGSDSNSFPITFPTKECRYIRIEIPALKRFGTGTGFYAALADLDFDVPTKTRNLKLSPFFENRDEMPVIASKLAEPGEMTQSLCSPWLHDYRDCVCFYWAASRPDYVDVDTETGRGHNWTDRGRAKDEDGKPVYAVTTEDPPSTILISYEDLFSGWEKKENLQFQIEGKSRDSVPEDNS